jgi:hypothetical protein
MRDNHAALAQRFRRIFLWFEQFAMAITRRRAAALTERLHLLRRHRFEAARNSQVLADVEAYVSYLHFADARVKAFETLVH